MQTFLKGKRVGYWLSEKKIKKLNFQAFAELCRKRGIEVVQLNLSRPIEEQGPLDVIIHKLTDVILEADQNDSQSLELVHRFQEYIDAHPETIVLDPLPAIRTLLDRSKSYELIRKIEAYMKDDRICSPPFMELTSLGGDDTMRLLEENGLAFPFICKTRVAHGTSSHEMAIVFNQEGLSAIQPPCVVQNFINHNAVLYKVFVVGESYTVVQRPSLKNFSAGTSDRESIFFNSHNVSKPESSSVLTALDKIEGVFERPSDEVIRELSRALRQALGVSLFGIDIIINNQTGQHAVIDINAFPASLEDASSVPSTETTEQSQALRTRLDVGSPQSPISHLSHCISWLPVSPTQDTHERITVALSMSGFDLSTTGLRFFLCNSTSRRRM
nr:inositol-tetrakisphosphate 1-kinase isoform X4 [Kogia breviceps]